jgi:hypothetical protein
MVYKSRYFDEAINTNTEPNFVLSQSVHYPGISTELSMGKVTMGEALA